TVEEQAAADPQLVQVGSSPESPEVVDRASGTQPLPTSSTYSYVLYEIRNSPIVTSLDEQPVVEHLSPTQWKTTSISWYQDESDWSVPITAGGPASWTREIPGLLVGPGDAVPVRTTTVSDVRMGDQDISFNVGRTGVPILVKIPYFPNWQATGAQGPWEATPDLMVVVPTSRHVVLRYGVTSVDWLGRAGSLLGVAGLVAISGSVPPVLPASLARRLRANEADRADPDENEGGDDTPEEPQVPRHGDEGFEGGDRLDAEQAEGEGDLPPEREGNGPSGAPRAPA
ncbi:MAG: hypothetical protein JWM85_727, partial [Acidimicrobiaceae bacterium]|nr:hypothetical protein [Acidimicrobiaceae bacterium]